MLQLRAPQRRDRPIIIGKDFKLHSMREDGAIFDSPTTESPSMLDSVRLTSVPQAPLDHSIDRIDRINDWRMNSVKVNGGRADSRRNNNSTSLDSGHTLSNLEGKTEYVRNDTLSSFNSKSSTIYQFTELPTPALSTNAEEPKIAIKKGLRSNWTLIAPHITAVFVTVAVCQLSFRDVFWMDLQPPEKKIAPGLTQSGALNFLQLAAKLHELLILASLSSIVLQVFQTSLTGPSGLPLGMMANAFELGSGGYLRRKSFWSSLWWADPATGKRFGFFGIWILSLSATIVITLSGPSSAIAIIPTLKYFNLPRPFNQTVEPLYIFNQSTELWPTQLSAASFNDPNSGNNCSVAAKLTGDMDVCPTGGFRETYSWSGALGFGDMNQGRNISFQDEQSNTRRVVTAQSCNSTFNGRASGVGINRVRNKSVSQ